MRRFIWPIAGVAFVATILWTTVFLWIPPVNGLVVAAWLTLGGFALASWGALGIYYGRLLWGPKDSPRFILRRSIRQGFFLALFTVGFLLLQLYGATNLVTASLLLGIIIFMERLS
ncbi:MAG TPA: hypothetical protein VFK94_05805 [Patescibacteria group bacterium]|nr:hypothetical protein [Patescibacteria group bacterium]